MKIFMTGATGFIGRHLVGELEADPRVETIFCLNRGSETFTDSVKVRYVTGSLENAAGIDLGVPVDVAVHLAGFWKKEDRKLLMKINAEGTRNIVDLCRKNKIPKIVFISTINVKLRHRGAYADSKSAAEKIVADSGLQHVIVRPTLVYGEGDSGMTKIVSFLRAGKTVPVFGKGDKLEQPVYIDELTAILKTAIFAGRNGDLVEAGGKEAMTYNDMLDAVAHALGNPSAKKLHLPAAPFLFGARILEILHLPSPITSEQIRHMTEDLDVDAKRTSSYHDVLLEPFAVNLKKYL